MAAENSDNSINKPLLQSTMGGPFTGRPIGFKQTGPRKRLATESFTGPSTYVFNSAAHARPRFRRAADIFGRADDRFRMGYVWSPVTQPTGSVTIIMEMKWMEKCVPLATGIKIHYLYHS
ncbi:hypothetical protein CTI12_AA581980 [Artemisia annua]|uniref:Uncharacterized protein n=1 Tax=Artemisia annua TaxID=35608 RepID=A0A2U1KNP5_ARTAN|nr:hypothetical protein CTI12_AA581980 [Artemisia annua]